MSEITRYSPEFDMGNDPRYPEPELSIDTEKNFLAYREHYLNLLKTKYPDDWENRLIRAEEFVAKLPAFIVSNESGVESVLTQGGLLPYAQRPHESRSKYGIRPEDRALNAENFIFGTFGKPQERGIEGKRVAFLVNPEKTKFFTMNDVFQYNPHTNKPELDYEILNKQKMHPKHLKSHFALMLALAYDHPTDFLTKHDQYVPTFPDNRRRYSRTELELRLGKITIDEVEAIVIENPDFKSQLLQLGFPEEKIIVAEGGDFLSSCAQAGQSIKK